MSSITRDITTAVAAALAGRDFGVEFDTATPRVPKWELKDLAKAKLIVVPTGIESERATRAASQWDVKLDIVVQKYLTTQGTAREVEIDRLAEFVEDIAAALPGLSLPDLETVKLISVAIDPLYDRDHLEDLNVFTGRLLATYGVMIHGQ